MANGVCELSGGFAEDVGSWQSLIGQQSHIQPRYAVETRGLKQDIEDVDVSREMDVSATVGRGSSHECLGSCMQGAAINPKTIWISQMDIENLMRSRGHWPPQH